MRVKDVAKILNVSTSTVRYYCHKGWINSTRTPGGQRYFTQDDINENRPGLQRLLTAVQKGKYTAVCSTYQDRLTRFGFSYVKQLIEQN